MGRKLPSTTSCEFSCVQGRKACMLLTWLRVNWASSVKRTPPLLICRRRGRGTHTQNSPGNPFYTPSSDEGKNHHHAKASIRLSVEYQSSRKFCVHLYVGFPALHLEHSVFEVVLHSLVGRNYSSLELLCTLWRVNQHRTVTTSIPPVVTRCSTSTISTEETPHKMHAGTLLTCMTLK